MHITRSALHLLFFLLPLFAQAQGLPPLYDHGFYTKIHFASPQDSSDFVQFRNGLQMADPALANDTTKRHRLAWSEHQQGGMWTVTRGDRGLLIGSVEMRDAQRGSIGLPYRTAEGRRAMVLWHEVPCAIVCRNVWYYEEE